MAAKLHGIRTKIGQPSRDIASRLLAMIAALFWQSGLVTAQGKIPVNIELVLALDSSASVDSKEFRLQIDGLMAAFQHPDVGQAVDNLRPFGVAVAVVQWGAPGETRVILPFTHLENARDAKAFGFRIGRVHRWMRASATSIATAISDSTKLLQDNEFDGQRLVIDVSGDGEDNASLSLDDAKAMAKAAGVIVNGLAIEAEEQKLAAYYRDKVIMGADAFVEPANGFEDFFRAMLAKLTRELRPLGS